MSNDFSPAMRVGFGNIVMTSRVIAVLSPDSAPIKRMIAEAKASGVLVDATHGRRTRALVLTDGGRLIASALLPETLIGRLERGDAGAEDENEAENSGE